MGFTNSQAFACSNSVNPYAQHGLLVLLQIISQCGIARLTNYCKSILLIQNVEKDIIS
jgi:hypothetical protein